MVTQSGPGVAMGKGQMRMNAHHGSIQRQPRGGLGVCRATVLFARGHVCEVTFATLAWDTIVRAHRPGGIRMGDAV